MPSRPTALDIGLLGWHYVGPDSVTAGATGIFSLPMEHLRTLLASCDAFQTWTSTLTPATAALLIYLVEEPAPAAARYAIIWQGDEFQSQADSFGSRNFFQDSGALMLRFVETVTDTVDRTAEIAFTNSVGLILTDAQGLSAQGGYLDVRRFAKTAGPALSEPDERQAGVSKYWVEFNVAWGGHG